MAGLVSVNLGVPRAVPYRGREVMTAIYKSPVAGPVALRGVNLDGDDQADRSVHGGVDKAVYSYAHEDYEWWSGELGGEPLTPGTFGENLTTTGLDLNSCLIGERWRVGSALLEVSEPRFPCFKLGIRMGSQRFLKRFSVARRPGAYLRIIEEGELAAGASVEVISRPDHEITIGLFAEAYLGDRSLLARLLGAEALSETWREWIEERLGRAQATRSAPA